MKIWVTKFEITVIATGFDRAGVRQTPAYETRSSSRTEESKPATHTNSQHNEQRSNAASNEFQPHVFNTDDLDIPAFLRNRSQR